MKLGVKQVNKSRKYVLMTAVVGLSIISVSAGYDFYDTLFGKSTAILCCTIFEMIRLACLWSFVSFKWQKKIVAIPLYSLVALTCGFAAITSFEARIIAGHARATKPLEEELSKRIASIKRAHAKNVSKELKVLQGKIDYARRQLAWDPASDYWNNRLKQLTTTHEAMVGARDTFLSRVPRTKREEWISRNASILDIELAPLLSTVRGTTATTKAIQELWGVSELTAKKAVAMIIVLTIEAGIIILSVLAQDRSNGISVKHDNHRLLKALRIRSDEAEIKKFVKRCETSLEKHGRLPLSRELSGKQREMRKLLRDGDFRGPKSGALGLS